MDTKKYLYKFVGIFSALIYLLIIILAIFEVEDFKFLDIAIKIIAIFFTPAIYLIFAGLGEILDYIETKELLDTNPIEIEENEEKIEPVQLEIPLDEEEKKDETSKDETNNDANEDAKEEVDENTEDSDEDENSNEESEEKDEENTTTEPEIKDGKIKCRYCGKYNKVKRTYCYLCAKKLRD